MRMSPAASALLDRARLDQRLAHAERERFAQCQQFEQFALGGIQAGQAFGDDVAEPRRAG